MNSCFLKAGYRYGITQLKSKRPISAPERRWKDCCRYDVLAPKIGEIIASAGAEWLEVLERRILKSRAESVKICGVSGFASLWYCPTLVFCLGLSSDCAMTEWGISGCDSARTFWVLEFWRSLLQINYRVEAHSRRDVSGKGSRGYSQKPAAPLSALMVNTVENCKTVEQNWLLGIDSQYLSPPATPPVDRNTASCSGAVEPKLLECCYRCY